MKFTGLAIVAALFLALPLAACPPGAAFGTGAYYAPPQSFGAPVGSGCYAPPSASFSFQQSGGFYGAPSLGFQQFGYAPAGFGVSGYGGGVNLNIGVGRGGFFGSRRGFVRFRGRFR